MNFLLNIYFFAEINNNKYPNIVDNNDPVNTPILTNMHSDLDYDQLKKTLPRNISPGFDGISVNL